MELEPQVRFSIEELVLDGVEPDDPAVREAVERALGDHPAADRAAHAAADAVAAEAGG